MSTKRPRMLRRVPRLAAPEYALLALIVVAVAVTLALAIFDPSSG